MASKNFTDLVNEVRGLAGNADKIENAKFPDLVNAFEALGSGVKTENSYKYDDLVTAVHGIKISGGSDGVLNSILDRSISGTYENDDITIIGASAFAACTELESVKFPNVTSIGPISDEEMPNDVPYVAGAFIGCTGLTSADFPKVMNLGAETFAGCTGLTSVNLPQVTTIHEAAFTGCTSLISIDLPKVTILGAQAFDNCTSLISIDLPKITVLDMRAFVGCSVLASVTIGTNSSTDICAMGTNAFFKTPIASGIGYIYVADSLVDGYKAATNWSAYANQIKGISEKTS